MKKETLLEKALAHTVELAPRREATEQEMELALAWARGEITLTQAQVAIRGQLTANFSTTYLVLARGLARYVLESNPHT